MQVDLERLVRDVVQGYFREERQPGAIPVGVSNRHVHLSHSDFATLFGGGEQGTQLKPLKQPGQFALKESVSPNWAQGCHRTGTYSWASAQPDSSGNSRG